MNRRMRGFFFFQFDALCACMTCKLGNSLTFCILHNFLAITLTFKYKNKAAYLISSTINQVFSLFIFLNILKCKKLIIISVQTWIDSSIFSFWNLFESNFLMWIHFKIGIYFENSSDIWPPHRWHKIIGVVGSPLYLATPVSTALPKSHLSLLYLANRNSSLFLIWLNIWIEYLCRIIKIKTGNNSWSAGEER